MDIGKDASKKIVVLIDADNAQIGKLYAIMAEIATHGHIIVKKAYGDWSSPSLKNWKDKLNFLAIQPIQQFAYTIGKNASDILIVLDAMDLLYTGKYDTFVLVSSDSDFTSLAGRLRASEIFVYGIGEKKTPVSFRNACDDFIFTENLKLLENVNENTNENVAQEESVSCAQNEGGKNIENVIDLLNIASDTYEDENGWTRISLAGDYLKRSMPDFNSKNYGFSKLSGLIKNLTDLFEMTNYKGISNVLAYRRKK
jgi:hypothetical protein